MATMSKAPAAELSAEDMKKLLNAQRTAFLKEGPPSAEVRRNRIDRLWLGVLEHAEELAEALSLDFGNRPALGSLSGDILGSYEDLELVRASLEAWMQPEVVAGSAERGTPTIIQKRPKGVVGVVGPWNYPITLVVPPVVEALAAGNRVMIKMSEITYRTAEVFASLIAEHFDPEEVVVIRGGRETAVAFSELQLDHILFTGSPGVGRQVAAAAGRNLVPVTLELGGKNPAVVGHDADIHEAARRIAAGRMLNNGQVCLCADYVFVPRTKADAFIEEYTATIERHFPDYATNRSY